MSPQAATYAELAFGLGSAATAGRSAMKALAPVSGVNSGSIRRGGTVELFTDARGAQVPGAVGVGPKDAAAVVKVQGEVAANSTSVTFGRVDNQISHTFRHIEAAGFDRSVVQSAITSDISRLGNTFPSNPYNGSVIVNGTKLDYVAYRLPDGTLNIGRITPSR